MAPAKEAAELISQSGAAPTSAPTSALWKCKSSATFPSTPFVAPDTAPSATSPPTSRIDLRPFHPIPIHSHPPILMLTGDHFINGERVGGAKRFRALDPARNKPLPTRFAEGGRREADRAARAAEGAFNEYHRGYPLVARAAFLRAAAEAIDACGAELTAIAQRETALPEARLNGERARTVGQLRMFADLAESGEFLEPRTVPPLPDRAPAPRPKLGLTHAPVGPVAVFGASNFPLAFSTAGGDTAAALAAGCPVVVKGHPAHPGTAETVATAIWTAADKCGLTRGVFNLVQGTGRQLGAALVSHPLVRAVGFTGSLAAGRTLFNLAAARPRPIPVYAEMGSVNPVFISPAAMAARAGELAAGWTQSLLLGGGQFCTNPGIVFCADNDDAERFVREAANRVATAGSQTTLTPAVAANYAAGARAMVEKGGASARASGTKTGRGGPGKPPPCRSAPALFEIGARNWIRRKALHDEVFGPAGLVVRCADWPEMLDAAKSLDGQLTATLHADDAPSERFWIRELLAVLERKAGRILWGGFPTGVEVCEAMMHGGPYPASTHAGFTSVGTLAIRRFLRPICWQGFPDALAPPELRKTGGASRKTSGKRGAKKS